MDEATIPELGIDAFAEFLPPQVFTRFNDAMSRGAEALHRHAMWHLNTTLTGGGVAEMLGAMLPYVSGAGIACRWVMVEGNDDFLDVTKRLHNALHGMPGSFSASDQAIYRDTLTDNADRLATKSAEATSSSSTTRRPPDSSLPSGSAAR
jgi:trehalose synthase